MVCLDSDILIEFLRNNAKVIDFIKKITEDGKNISTTTINSFELFKGATIAPRRNPIKNIEEFLSTMNILLFDLKSSKKAAEIFENLKSKGKMIDELDILIASIAISNDETILTLNKKHFLEIPGLKIEDVN